MSETATAPQITSFSAQEIIADKNIRDLDQEHVSRLTDSMRNIGMVINPITVRMKDGKPHLIAGYHRFAAAQEAGIDPIPVAISEHSEDEAGIISISENLLRKDLSYSETVAAVRELKEHTNWDIKQIAQKLSIHTRSVIERIHISELPQEFIVKGENNPPLRKQFRAFARLADDRRAIAVSNVIEFADTNNGRYPTAPLMEKLTNKLSLGLNMAKFDTAECQKCPMNTACSTSLFGDTEDPDGICTSPECFDKKTAAALDQIAKEAHTAHNVPNNNRVHFEASIDLDSRGQAEIENGGKTSVLKFTPWRPQDLGEATNGCQECENRLIATQSLLTQHVAAPICAKTNCYDALVAEQAEDTEEQTAATSGSTAKESKSSGKDEKKAGKKSGGVIKALDRKVAAITAQRRIILEKAVAETAQTIKDGAAVIRCMLALLHNDIVTTDSSSKLDKIADLKPEEVQAQVRKAIVANATHVNGKTLYELHNILGGMDILLPHLGLHDESFLTKLTIAELLALLKEGGFEDEAQWKKLRSAKKTAVINAILEYSFADDFIPECMKPKAGDTNNA